MQVDNMQVKVGLITEHGLINCAVSTNIAVSNYMYIIYT